MVEWKVRLNPDTGCYDATITVSFMPTRDQAVAVCRAAHEASHIAIYGDLTGYREPRHAKLRGGAPSD